MKRISPAKYDLICFLSGFLFVLLIAALLAYRVQQDALITAGNRIAALEKQIQKERQQAKDANAQGVINGMELGCGAVK